MMQASVIDEITRLTDAVIAELDAAAAAGRANLMFAKELGGLANLLGNRALLQRAERILAGASAHDFFAGALTNIDPGTVGIERLRSVHSAEEFSDANPIYDASAVKSYLEKYAQGSRHLAPCLEGDTTSATHAAVSDLDFEELGCTLAVLGHFDAAKAVVDSRPVPEFRRRGVRIVIVAESCRRRLPSFPDEIALFDPRGWERLIVILALTGRLPWTGYPYPDW